MADRFDIVLGDEVMGLYKNGKLAVKATKLTFGDILEACDISCDIWSADLDQYDSPDKLPPLFKDVKRAPTSTAPAQAPYH